MLTLFRSESLPALSGMTEKEYDSAVEGNAADIVLECDRPRIKSMLEKTLREGKDADFTYRILHRKHGSVWVHARARLIGTLENCPVLMTAFQDTSAEAQEHAFLLDHAMASIYVVDIDTHELLFLNGPAMKALDRSDYSGKICHDFVNGLDSVCAWCPLPYLEGGFCRRDGLHNFVKNKWFNVSCREMDWHGRRAAAVYAIDITEEKERQQSLELDKKSLSAIVDNIPIGVSVCEIRNDRIKASVVNSQLTEMLCMTAEDFVSPAPRILELVHPEDRKILLSSIADVRTHDSRVRFEFRFLRGGEYRWYHTETRTLRQGDLRTIFVCVSDVTTEKKAQEEMLRSKQIYEAAVEEGRLVAWVYDIHARRITMADSDFTSSQCRKLGFPKVIENVPDSLTSYIDEKCVPDFVRMYTDLASGASNASCEIWFGGKAGEERRCDRISYTAVFGPDGKPLCAYGIGQDITAQKQEEEKYAKAYQELEEAYPYSLGSFHLNLTRNWCGKGKSPLSFVLEQQKSGTADGYFLEFSKLIADDSIRNRFFEIFDRKKLLADFQTGKTRVSIEYPIVYQDGVTHWREGLLFMLQNPRTEDVEAVTYAIDIDERKKNEKIIDHLTSKKFDYIAILYLGDRTIEFCNRQSDIQFSAAHTRSSYEDWREYLRSHFLPSGEEAGYDAGTDLDRIASELAEHGEYVFSFRQVENNVFSRRQIQYSWLDRAHGEILAVRADVTAAYEQEQEQLHTVTKALRKAEAANEAKTEFISRISHDIRTPISIIQSMTGFAAEDAGDRQKLMEDLRRIEASNTFLLSLINDVLDISKIDSGKIELQPEPYLFDDYISNIRNMFEPLCHQKGLHFVIENRGAAGTILTDHTRLNQITLNLLSNAVKYTPPGGTVSFAVSSSALPDGNIRCTIEVKDTGIGMSREFQSRMFEPFSQEYDNPNRPKAGTGTGLGLSIVRRLIDMIGGAITVSSDLGKGTDVQVRFTAPAGKAEIASPVPDEKPTPEEKLSGKVLVAEDNQINTEIILRILESLGLTADPTGNGLQVLKRFQNSAPGEYRAILMDIQMPVMNGYEAAEQIRALARPDAKTIPIIAMTADAFSAALERSKKSGMTGYVTKPLSPQEIRKALTENSQNSARAADGKNF